MIGVVLLVAVAVTFTVAVASTADALRLHRMAGRRPDRALGMAGRLALPAPDDEQCRRRRALLDATGRPDPTGIPGCGTGDSARWDPVRCGWVRERDGEFTPWRPLRGLRARPIPMPPAPDDRRG